MEGFGSRAGDPYKIITDPDPGGPETYESGPLVLTKSRFEPVSFYFVW